MGTQVQPGERMTDAELIARAIDGSEEAFEEFILRYRRLIRCVINEREFHLANREDIFQETLVKIWKVLPTIAKFAEKEPRRVQNYCCQVAKTMVLQFRKTRGNVRLYSLGEKRGPTQPGDRFGKLLVTKILPNKKCLCRCECGKETTPDQASLRRGVTRSCGNYSCREIRPRGTGTCGRQVNTGRSVEAALVGDTGAFEVHASCRIESEVEAAVENAEMAESLLSVLPPYERAFIDGFMEGLTPKENSKRQGVHKDSVYRVLDRAFGRLREMAESVA